MAEDEKTSANDEAEEKDETDEESSSEEGKSKRIAGKKIVMIAAAALVVIGAGAGGAYFMGVFDGSPKAPEKKEKIAKPAFFYDLPEMVVNLNTPDGRAEFLKVSITLELEKKEDITVLKPVEPRILDVFQVYLRELRRDDLTGSAGLFRLKSELLKRVNIAAHPQKVSAVLFKEIIVQ